MTIDLNFSEHNYGKSLYMYVYIVPYIKKSIEYFSYIHKS